MGAVTRTIGRKRESVRVTRVGDRVLPLGALFIAALVGTSFSAWAGPDYISVQDITDSADVGFLGYKEYWKGETPAGESGCNYTTCCFCNLNNPPNCDSCYCDAIALAIPDAEAVVTNYTDTDTFGGTSYRGWSGPANCAILQLRG